MKKIFIPIFICLCLIAYVVGYTTTTTTTNLSLVKPASEDTTVDWFDTMNDNLDLIDAIFDDVTLTEFGYLDGVTSAIQTQLDAKTPKTQEEIEDYAGAMWTGNTETFLTLTYQDADGTIDAVVPVKDEDNMASDSATHLATQQSIKAYADTLHALQYLKTEMDSFSEIQAIISDKTLVNEEDIFTIDANWVNTANPWADNEVANNITIDLSTLATTFTVTDNENEALACPIIFVDGATGSQGAESDDTDFTYNPSTGTMKLTALDLTTVLPDAEVANNITIDLSTLATTFTATDNESEALACPIVFVDGATGAQGAETDDTDFTYNPSTGTLTVTALDLTTALPDAEVANNITIDLATLATTITVTDNESTNENNPLCFVAGADPDGGSLGIETDGDLHYNPSTGLMTATGFAGALTGNVTGNASGSSGSCTGLAATATALATGRNIGGVSFDGTAAITPIYLSIDHALGSDEDYSGITDSAPVGETVAIGDLLYYDFGDVEWKKAKADAIGTTPAMRIALATGNNGDTVLMLVHGYIRDDDAFDFGAARIFLNDDTAGTCDDTAPAESGDQIQVVGIGITADILYFCPSVDVGEI